MIGQQSVFVRCGGCDYRCSWCDSLFAVEKKYRPQWQTMSAVEALKKIETLSEGNPILVTLTGGNPALQSFGELIRLGEKSGHRFSLETQGSVAAEWFSELDYLVLSPKPPSSGMSTDFDKLKKCVKAAGAKTNVALKIVVADREDFDYAVKVSHLHPELTCTLQPCNTQADQPGIDFELQAAQLRQLAAWVLAEQWPQLRVLPQLHVLMWGNERQR